MSLPEGIAFDVSGNLWVSNAAFNNVVELNAVTGTSFGPKITQNLNLPIALAFDIFGNLWVPNNNTSTITAFSTLGLPVATVTAGVSGPTGLAFSP